ncbi:pilus assembly protein TadG-related protein [Mesorhizobium sp. M0830]|uniref:TadE/TadG family type IV pilus assembly protein n=1 Tax=Mesorhizobium sp. M0830 TaxID=2957008 RepID=UPI00333B336C
MLRTIRAFWHDQRGIALILVSVMLPAIIGFSLLAIDMSRMNNLHNDLQKGTDALALAAAAELDGRSDSITRADRALATLVSNNYNFSTADGPVTLAAAGVTRRYLRSLPATDDVAIATANVVPDEVADANLAQFVEVRVTPVGFSTIFPASFLSSSASNSYNIGAVAVAGFSRSACDFTPVYICNPYENTTDTLYTVAADPAKRRRLIELRQQGGSSAQNSPGNYGFLQPPDSSSGADAIRDMIAEVKSQACYNSRGVLLRPGFLATARDALNVRFDVYNGPMNSNRNDPNFAPGENVRKGYKTQGNACNADAVSPAEPTNFEAFPRDNGTIDTNGRIGNGNWDFDQYWNTNFNTTTAPVTVPKPMGADGVNPASNTNQPTRYSVYRYEISQGIVGHPSNGGEIGTPSCSANKVSNPDRRLLYGAILNCQALAAAGLMSGGNSSPPLPVEAFGSFLITETVESGSDQTIRVELVDINGRGGQGTLDNFLRDEAQLYR